MRITFHGAADTVTGSCHLLETSQHKILFDCGTFQGHGLSDRNAEKFPFDPSEIDFVFLSHAHLDHCGRLPLLTQAGFEGQIVCTWATHDLARLVLLDSASMMEEDARRRNRGRRRTGQDKVEPLYRVEDVMETLDRFDVCVSYDEPLELEKGLRVTFRDAGHILGSAFIELKVTEPGAGGPARRITYSGDLGNLDKPLIRDPQNPSPADVVILESTYGDRNHRAFDDSVEEFKRAVVTTLARGGNAIIPSFALERAQELLYLLHGFYRAGDLPRCQIFLDSPMAIDATKIFSKHGECFDEEALALAAAGGNPFDFELLHYVRHTDDSREINNIRSGAIIIAGSGMCTGGRILHHLRHNLWRPECSVIFPGYCAEGTPGRRIIDGEATISVSGQPVANRAEIWTINGFSAHAGQQTLVDWLDETGDPELILLVHGEDRAEEALAHQIDEALGMTVERPKLGQTIEL
jgi:metallo-beta-lactamase family protein